MLHSSFGRLVQEDGWSLVEYSNTRTHTRTVLTKENVRLEHDASRDGIFDNITIDIYEFPIDLVIEFLELSIPDASSPFHVVSENFELVRGALSVPETRGRFREWRIAKEKRPDERHDPQPPAIDLLSRLKHNVFTLLPWRQT